MYHSLYIYLEIKACIKCAKVIIIGFLTLSIKYFVQKYIYVYII